MAKLERLAPPASAKASPPEAAVKSKRKKLPLILIGLLFFGAAGGAGWHFTKGNDTKAGVEVEIEVMEPKFITLEPFTVNLQRETGDQFLQVGITLKIVEPGQKGKLSLEEKIKLIMPEIRSHLLLLLSSKYPSELAPAEGKKKLAQEIIAGINGVLGLRSASTRPEPNTTGHEDAASGAQTVPPEEAPATAEAAPETAEAAPASAKKDGLMDVLFTSFIIQ